MKAFLGICFVLAFITPLLATSITTTAPGGDPAGGYQATAPTFNNGDRIRGHVMFKDGLTLAGHATVTWDSQGVVNGLLTSTDSFSRFTLATDLRLGSTISFASPPNVPMGVWFDGHGNRIILGGDVIFPKNKHLYIGYDELIIDGQGHVWSVRNRSAQVAFKSSFGSAALTLKNIFLNGVIADGTVGDGVAFFNVPNIVLDNVSIGGGIALEDGGTALCNSAVEALTIRGKVCLDMPSRRVKLFTAGNLVVTIEKNSTLYVGKNTIFEWRNAVDGSSVAINFADKTSVLHLDDCDFYTGANGLTLTKGTVIFENKVRIFNKDYGSSTPNVDFSKALTFGDGTPENDIDVKILGGAYVTLEGCMASK